MRKGRSKREGERGREGGSNIEFNQFNITIMHQIIGCTVLPVGYRCTYVYTYV